MIGSGYAPALGDNDISWIFVLHGPDFVSYVHVYMQLNQQFSIQYSMQIKNA